MVSQTLPYKETSEQAHEGIIINKLSKFSIFVKNIYIRTFTSWLNFAKMLIDTYMIKVETDKAPKAIGPYSQAVRVGGFLYISGQIAINPATGKLIKEGTKGQTVQVIKNIEAILSTQNIGTKGHNKKFADLSNVVKTEIFLQNINDFKDLNEAYASKFIQEPLPARQVIEVSELPLNAKVEISCIAYLG